MKKYNIILSAIFILVFVSCSDYFNAPVKGRIDSDLFYSSLNNFRYGLNSAFNLMQGADYQSSEYYFGEAISDNCWNKADTGSGDLTQLLNFTFNNNNSEILNRYSINYRGINICNQLIRSVPHIVFDTTFSSTYDEIRSIYGQAKVLRALYYFNLVKTFSGVPIQPENIDLHKIVIPRSSKKEVYDYIEKDLREAVLLLKKSRLGGGEGGISVGYGLGLLMKVLLYEASPGTGLDIDRDAKMQEALQIGKYFIEGVNISVDEMLKFSDRYSDESWEELYKRLFLKKSSIIDQNTILKGIDVYTLHQLLPEFNKVFRLSGEFSVESLFEINHFDFAGSVSVNEAFPMADFLNMQTQPTKELFDLYVTANDPRGLLTVIDRTGGQNGYWLNDGDTYLGSTSVFGWYFSWGAYTCFTKFAVFPSEGSKGGRNYRVMRYAEALLIYAEILNETGHPQDAIKYVNMVRKRAQDMFLETNPTAKYQSTYAPTPADFKLYETSLPKNIVKDAILNEKRAEMAAEGDRWFELARLGILAERMNYLYNHRPAMGSGEPDRERGKYFRKGVNEIFPIPEKEVRLSGGVIEQNFGY